MLVPELVFLAFEPVQQQVIVIAPNKNAVVRRLQPDQEIAGDEIVGILGRFEVIE